MMANGDLVPAQAGVGEVWPGFTPFGHDLVRYDEAGQPAGDEITTIRNQLTTLRPWQQTRIDAGLWNIDVPAEFRPTDSSPGSVRHIAEFDDEKLVDFLGWYVEYNEAVNGSDVIQVRTEICRANYLQQVELAVAGNRLHPAAASAVDKIPDVPVSVGDPIKLGMRGCDGYYSRTEGVVLAQNFDRHPFGHEMSHAAFPAFPVAPLMEAVNEQVTLGLESGDMYTLQPGKRQDTGAYPVKRRGLATVADSGVEKIDASVILDYGIEPNGEAGPRLWDQSHAAYSGNNPWIYYARSYNGFRRDVDELHPDFDKQVRDEAADTYASLNISALGAIKKGVTVRRMGAQLDEYAAQAQAFVDRLEGTTPDPRTYQYQINRLNAEATSAARNNFYQGTGFLDDEAADSGLIIE